MHQVEAFTLPEGLILLAIDDESGRIVANSGALDLALAGAAIADLLLTGHLAAVGGNLIVAHDAATNDPVLDATLATISASKPHDSKHWVKNLGKIRIRERLLERLIARGVIRREEHRILWIFPTDRFPTENAAPERALRTAIRAVVIDEATPQPRPAALIALLQAANLTGMVFARDERTRYKDRIETLASGVLMGEAVAKAVREAQAAVAAAVIASTTAATVATS